MDRTEIIKMLLENLKAEGLEIAEESAKSAYVAVTKTIKEFVIATENPYDDLILPAFSFADKRILPLLEDINPADNDDV